MGAGLTDPGLIIKSRTSASQGQSEQQVKVSRDPVCRSYNWIIPFRASSSDEINFLKQVLSTLNCDQEKKKEKKIEIKK